MGVDLDPAALPSLGFVRAASPVTSLPGLARALGCGTLTVKRDDRLDALHGGTKARKLDVLLATPPFRDAAAFVSMGAIGSGHLAACAAAASVLGRTLHAHLFYEPLSAGVLDHLAFVASGPTRLHYYGTRVELALRRPRLFLQGTADDGAPVIPPGASLPAAVAGVARAGFELAEQIERGELPAPDAVWVPYGTGGTVAGLALGLGLAGVRCPVLAVATVERVFTQPRTVRRLVREGAAWLTAHGVPASPEGAAPVRVVRGHVGPGYGVPTAASLAAVEILRTEGIPLEPVYSGKAFGALLAAGADRRLPRHVLFWSTAAGGPLPHDPDWRERLPPRLQRRLASATRPGVGRRAVLVGAVAAGALAVGLRVTGYPALAWTGAILAAWEAHVLAAAARVLTGVDVDGYVVAANVDRYLVAAPPGMQAEVHQLLALVEHGTALGLRTARFTALEASAREAFLLTLGSRGGLLAQAFRGLRDLCLLGAYQEVRAWRGLGYAGPWPDGVTGPESHLVPYASFRAPAGVLPT